MKAILIFTVFVLFAENLLVASTCLEFFAANPENKNRDDTGDLIAYLASLLEKQIIGEIELHRMLENLTEREFANPISEARGWVDSAALLHREQIQEYLDTTNLDTQKILLWAKRNLREIENVKFRREETRNKTEDIHQKMIFYPIPPGKFEMGEKHNAVAIELTHTIEMMSTPVTQKHWVDLMILNPSYFLGSENPVEGMTWWSAVFFANKLSKIHGLKPAYNLDDMEFTFSPEDGSLMLVRGRLKVNSPDGDIYATEGYRLPTEAEQEYVRKNLGHSEGLYFSGNDERDLKRHAWFEENSNNIPHPVAELDPLIIAGHPFYDLFGNVHEWGHDSYETKLKAGKNPSNTNGGDCRVFRGGACDSATDGLRTMARDGNGYNTKNYNLGFRLVRTIK